MLLSWYDDSLTYWYGSNYIVDSTILTTIIYTQFCYYGWKWLKYKFPSKALKINLNIYYAWIENCSTVRMSKVLFYHWILRVQYV